MRLVREREPGLNKRYSIRTYGCQMNENDSEKLAGMLEAMGYARADRLGESDLVIYNTCCVRENAELKVYGHLGSLKALKNRKPDAIIAVCGCMAQQDRVVNHILEKYRHVDLVFGTFNLYRFPELLYKALNSEAPVVDVSAGDGHIAEGMPIRREHGVKAWITIIYGCNNFCSYCIVPYVRGRERSRKPEDIINEARMLGRQGYKEITLLGQNVNSYGKDLAEKISFAGLLRRLNEVDGIERIRFMTSHPKDLSDELILAMRDCGKVCEHLHLPVQAGSNAVLKDMNRKYTREHYFALVNRIREHVPDISITTDIIVGYPGETDKDFEDTLDLVERVKFDFVYTFLYSKRMGTPAAEKGWEVSEEVKKARFDALVSIQNEIGREINERLAGKVLEVLVEGPSKNNINVLTGRTRTNKIVNFKGNPEMTGRLANVKITGTGTWSLDGEPV
ncbi:MAG: tRNA (N6-isopentenyl adenosine(37)-C2)-methylthiotransferase MiaB [Bacillota bacterium]